MFGSLKEDRKKGGLALCRTPSKDLTKSSFHSKANLAIKDEQKAGEWGVDTR